MKATTETALVRQCLDYLAFRGIMAWRQNSGAMVGEYKGKRRFVRFAGVKGLSDIAGVLPDGRALYIEVKRPGKSPTVEQTNFLDRVKKLGGVALWVIDVKQLMEAGL